MSVGCNHFRSYGLVHNMEIIEKTPKGTKKKTLTESERNFYADELHNTKAIKERAKEQNTQTPLTDKQKLEVLWQLAMG